MEGKSDPLDLNVVLFSKSFNTPGNEITPGSDVVGKDFQNNRFRHDFSPSVSLQPETAFVGVILRSRATKNLIGTGSAEILRGVYSESAEGFRMAWNRLRLDTS
jgi:hypothetical protein